MSKIKWSNYVSRIPSRVHVAPGVWYEVVYVDSFNIPSVVGETRFDARQIVLKRGQSDKELVHTYWHEYAHVISHEHDIQLTENQVISLEKSLYYFIKPGNLFKKEKRNVKTKRRTRTTT